MKIKKQGLMAILLLVILISFVSLGAAAPVGTSESATVAAANSWLGVKSVHGGNDRSGIDCSHLVYQVYNQVGAKDIVFQTVPNMKKNKNYVTVSSLAPGDIVFWQKDVIQNGKTYWLSDHVGIYIGNEQFIDTSFDTKTVAIESISGVYKNGMPYYARWESDGSNNTSTQVPNVATNNDSKLPVAAFFASPISGNVPLKVSFTDKSTGATSWSWIFGDGNTSTKQNPTHTYVLAGVYKINLTVNNAQGASMKTATVNVQSQSSSSDKQKLYGVSKLCYAVNNLKI